MTFLFITALKVVTEILVLQETRIAYQGLTGWIAEAPNTKIIKGTKYVDNGKIITSGGISAGIEMALHVVAKQHGIEQARKTANYMEYTWNEQEKY